MVDQKEVILKNKKDYPCPCSDKYPSDGICMVPSEIDGLLVRCVGSWSNNKHYYIDRYMGILTKGMRKAFKGINYIDLFSGPGMCRVRGTKEITMGSPLLSSKYDFDRYFFVDKSEESIRTLQQRFEKTDKREKAEFYVEDCNRVADLIRGQVSNDSINLIVADQTNVQLQFNTLEVLTKDLAADLIVFFPSGVFFNRGLPTIKDPSTVERVNAFFGDNGETVERWRRTAGNRNMELVRAYGERLESIGYLAGIDNNLVAIDNEDKNVNLYWLVFASKNERGRDFWGKIQAIEHDGQRKLFN